jgi:hypothetical protein
MAEVQKYILVLKNELILKEQYCSTGIHSVT